MQTKELGTFMLHGGVSWRCVLEVCPGGVSWRCVLGRRMRLKSIVQLLSCMEHEGKVGTHCANKRAQYFHATRRCVLEDL